ncbi:Ger(x)C family spore germination protein [Paenibacillus nanensis]|uniref:Ger(X)C family spore germination protein n=1 Tax=Paenibacillus nanensis TaxID=393251 RepID=A0A3A1UYA5_9BACL|nr:Ger(x)C family spore germination protein [Paenibacillus nanensis]RIX52666.1 Ger(x)C family spore germination protein [Paenibacillus nanensis]
MMAAAKKRIRTAAAGLLTLICLLLSGCWDEVNLQNISYITALGIDYKDGQFTLYAQMLTFSAIAKTESPQQPTDPVWIGKSQGDSVQMAYFNLSRAGYTTLSLDQLKTIVVHERAMNQLGDVLDGLNRQRASRYTTILYGTSISLDKLFSTEYFFNLSPLNSPLYAPEQYETQYTFVQAQTMQSFVQQVRDPGMTALLLDLSATESYWLHSNKKINTQLINGVHVFKNLSYQGFAMEKDVLGIRWLNPAFQKVYMKVELDDSMATVNVINSSVKRRAKVSGEDAHFELNIQLEGHIVEMDGQLTKQQLTAAVEQKVKEEIEAAYRHGVQKKMDLLQLEHVLYRYHNGYWKANAADGKWRPRTDALTVNVKMILSDSGKFEMSSGT